MNLPKLNITHTLKRPAALVMALLFLASTGSGVVMAAPTGGQVQYRSIKMSDNGRSGSNSITSGVGSGTNVTYRVTFQAASDYDLKGVVLDFCPGTGGTPFIGDATCGAMTGFTVGGTPTVDTSDYSYGSGGSTQNFTGLGSTSNWTTTSTNSGQTFKMENTVPAGVTLDHSEDPVANPPVNYSFAISGITNTSVLGTFYARLITYSDVGANGSYQNYTHANPGTYQDYGGFALSTAEIVQVTAKVQETLSFCVSDTTDQTAYPDTTLIAPTSCTDVSDPAIILGHGTNQTLDASQVDTNSIWTIASTNALRGLSIRMHNSNACGGLSTDNGVTCLIPAINSGAGTPGPFAPTSAPVAAFGMFCYDSDTGATVVGATTCDANYHDPTATTFPTNMNFGMDTTTTGENVKDAYGDIVAQSTAPVSNVRNRFDFAATASNTTPAGIYKANLAMIATGTF